MRPQPLLYPLLLAWSPRPSNLAKPRVHRPHAFAAAAPQSSALPAEFAGTALGLSVVELVDQVAAQMVTQASLAARAGADLALVAGWIPVGVKRAEDIQASRSTRRL
jgi:hypothetical protein